MFHCCVRQSRTVFPLLTMVLTVSSTSWTSVSCMAKEYRGRAKPHSIYNIPFGASLSRISTGPLTSEVVTDELGRRASRS